MTSMNSSLAWAVDVNLQGYTRLPNLAKSERCGTWRPVAGSDPERVKQNTCPFHSQALGAAHISGLLSGVNESEPFGSMTPPGAEPTQQFSPDGRWWFDGSTWHPTIWVRLFCSDASGARFFRW